jgi:hypothetical protein
VPDQIGTEIKRDSKMIHKRTLRRWSGVLALSLLFLANSMGVFGMKTLKGKTEPGRADIITIDALKRFGALERPAVVFYHDKHTTAVEKQNKDCTACHLSEKKKRSLKFMRLKDENPETVMNIYHDNCIRCHTDTAAAGEKSGPVECGECHKRDIAVESIRAPKGFDKSLHYRHSKADEQCGDCHHAYNETTKELFYDKGKEGTCRYCHKAVAEENRISFRSASHTACLDCHSKTLAQNKIAGPVTCSGCHDPAEQALIAAVENIPRMKRNQPDVVFVKAVGKNDADPASIRMNPVPFNHKAHESYNATCRVCHHAELNACVSCHSLAGSKENNTFKLEQAMHRVRAESSCIGCHTETQSDARCAGCHDTIAKAPKQDSDACLTCHTSLPSGIAAPPDISADTTTATALLSSRRPITATYAQADIPEKVVIKTLAKEYEPVELPHRKIINTLLNNIKDSRLAGTFHREAGTICKGCHHNSPATIKPPGCVSCHGVAFDEDNILRPGLKAAYHRQCMECHDAMGIEKPVAADCTGCHRKKA